MSSHNISTSLSASRITPSLSVSRIPPPLCVSSSSVVASVLLLLVDLRANRCLYKNTPTTKSANTSALDSKNEKVVQAALDRLLEENKRGCAIVVAHRLSTIKQCDKIIVMDHGQKVEEGSHDELLKIPIVKKKEEKLDWMYGGQQVAPEKKT